MLGSCLMRPGLCSVTLRALGVETVAHVAAEAGLEAIEWGGDVHVPPGDLAAADAARAAGDAAGLAVASYSSYFRAGDDSPADFAAVRETAERLGAPRIRIWAGSAGSAGASPERRAAVADAVRRAAETAHGMEVALEYHKGTLTDDPRSTLALLEAVARPSVRAYWQPPEGMPDGLALDGLRRLLPHVGALHVFSWWPGTERRPLAERAALWRAALDLAGDVDALLEFVPGDDPAVVAREAATLRELGG